MTRISFLTVQQNVAVLMAAMSSQTPNPVASLEEEYRRPWDGRAATVGTRRQTTGSEPAIDRSTKKPRRNPTMSSLQSIQGDGNGAGAGRVVTQLRTNDVLMGRGAPIAYYRGNVKFRELVKPWKREYALATNQRRKQEIAKHIYDEVGKCNGRFLAKMEPTEAASLGVPAGQKAWLIADEVSALEKVKQALREKDAAEAFIPTAPSQAGYIQRDTRPRSSYRIVSQRTEPWMAGIPDPRHLDQQSNLHNTSNNQYRFDPFTSQANPADRQAPSQGAMFDQTSQWAALLQQAGLSNPNPFGAGSRASIMPPAASAINPTSVGATLGNIAASRVQGNASELFGRVLDFSMQRPRHVTALSRPESDSISIPQLRLDLIQEYREQQDIIRRYDQLESLLLRQQQQQPQRQQDLPARLPGPLPGWSSSNSPTGNASNAISSFTRAGFVPNPRDGLLQRILEQQTMTQRQSALRTTADEVDPAVALFQSGFTEVSQSDTRSPLTETLPAYLHAMTHSVPHQGANLPTITQSTMADLLRRSTAALAATRVAAGPSTNSILLDATGTLASVARAVAPQSPTQLETGSWKDGQLRRDPKRDSAFS